MAEFHVDVPDDLAKEFRMLIIGKYGSERGAISKAVTEAIKLWVSQEKEKPKRK